MTKSKSSVHTISPVVPALAAALCLTLSSFAFARDFWGEDVWSSDERGFLYYPDTEADKPALAPDLNAMETIGELRAERERRLDEAVMRPTEENMRLYLEANHFVQEKSALFADQWRRTLWQNPGYDFTTRNPAANFAQVELKADRTRQKQEDIKTLARNWGLVYFYRSDCRFCALQSPLVRKLADDYGFEILPIALDGMPNEYFPDWLPDNGVANLLTNGMGVGQVPALFMVDRRQSQSHLISSGVLSLEDMLNRIVLLGTTNAGDSLFGGSEARQTAGIPNPAGNLSAPNSNPYLNPPPPPLPGGLHNPASPVAPGVFSGSGPAPGNAGSVSFHGGDMNSGVNGAQIRPDIFSGENFSASGGKFPPG